MLVPQQRTVEAPILIAAQWLLSPLSAELLHNDLARAFRSILAPSSRAEPSLAPPFSPPASVQPSLSAGSTAAVKMAAAAAAGLGARRR